MLGTPWRWGRSDKRPTLWRSRGCRERQERRERRARAPGQPRGEHGELLQSCGWSAARATESFWLEEPLKIIGSNRNTAPARTHVLRTSSTSPPNPPGMGTPPVWIGKAFSPEAAALRRGCISILKGFLDLGG